MSTKRSAERERSEEQAIKRIKETNTQLQEEVNMLRQQLKDSNEQLTKYKDDLKWARKWQAERERQYVYELEYSKQYDDDSYCRFCGKSSCRC